MSLSWQHRRDLNLNKQEAALLFLKESNPWRQDFSLWLGKCMEKTITMVKGWRKKKCFASGILSITQWQYCHRERKVKWNQYLWQLILSTSLKAKRLLLQRVHCGYISFIFSKLLRASKNMHASTSAEVTPLGITSLTLQHVETAIKLCKVGKEGCIRTTKQFDLSEEVCCRKNIQKERETHRWRSASKAFLWVKSIWQTIKLHLNN